MTETVGMQAIELGRAQACSRWHEWVDLARVQRRMAVMFAGYRHAEDALGLRRREHRAAVNVVRNLINDARADVLMAATREARDALAALRVV